MRGVHGNVTVRVIHVFIKTFTIFGGEILCVYLHTGCFWKSLHTKPNKSPGSSSAAQLLPGKLEALGSTPCTNKHTHKQKTSVMDASFQERSRMATGQNGEEDKLFLPLPLVLLDFVRYA